MKNFCSFITILLLVGSLHSLCFAQGKLVNGNGGHFIYDSTFVRNEFCHTDTLYNTGDTDIIITSLVFTGPYAANFRVLGFPSMPYTLKAHSSILISVCGTPTVRGWNDAVMTFNANPLSLDVPLRIFGLGACMKVMQDTLFSGVILLQDSSKTFCDTVVNCGDISSDYSASIISFDASAYSVLPEKAEKIQPGDSAIFCVTFHPHSLDSADATLIISTAPNLYAPIPLRGDVGCANLKVLPFEIPKGGGIFTITITNTGNYEWEPGWGILAGIGGACFKVLSIVPDPIRPGQQAILTIEFNSSNADCIANLSFPNGGPCQQSIVSIDLFGKGSTNIVNSSSGKGFTLGENYPNPFKNSTHFTYTTPKESEISLLLSDMTGRILRTIVRGRVSEGEHSVDFDASDLPSGSYLLLLESGEAKLSRQINLAK